MVAQWTAFYNVPKMNEQIQRAAEVIRSADALLIAAGAGMGVDSGLPDFRGTEGFWRAYPVIARLGLPFEEIANPSWFVQDPALAWAFYGHRLHLYRETVPHAGFDWLREVGAAKREGYFVFTSNVDGQFQKAGFDPERMVECHGSIHHLQCVARCHNGIWKAAGESIAIEPETFRAQGPLPKCPRCGGLARPNVLMFGDWGWLRWRSEEQEQRLGQWLIRLGRVRARLAVIEIGAGSTIPSVRMTAERTIGRHPATLIRINPRESAVPAGQIGLGLNALEAIREIGEKYRSVGSEGGEV